MIKGSLVLTFLLLNTLCAQEYLDAKDIPSRHDLEMQFLKDSFTPVAVVSEASLDEEKNEDELADEVNTQAAAPVANPIRPIAHQEEDEDFILPLEQEMFGDGKEKIEKPSRTKKDSNHKRRLR